MTRNASEALVYSQLRFVWERRPRYLPTTLLADFTGYSERYTRLILGRLEKSGLVARRGQRGGWRPLPAGAAHAV